MSEPKTPINYQVHGEIVDSVYANMADPAVAASWSVPVLKMLVLVASGRYKASYYADILANALMVLAIEDREWFLNNYSVPGNVTERFDELPPWPTPDTLEQFPTPSAEDLALYIEQMDRRLVLFAESESARVTKKGDRMSMAYTQKFHEASKWAVMTASQKSSADTASSFPYLHEHSLATETSMDTATSNILAQGVPWNTINAKIEGERDRFQKACREASSISEVKAAYDLRSSNITGLIDLIAAGA